jgi:hypothetical protein
MIDFEKEGNEEEALLVLYFTGSRPCLFTRTLATRRGFG